MSYFTKYCTCLPSPYIDFKVVIRIRYVGRWSWWNDLGLWDGETNRRDTVAPRGVHSVGWCIAGRRNVGRPFAKVADPREIASKARGSWIALAARWHSKLQCAHHPWQQANTFVSLSLVLLGLLDGQVLVWSHRSYEVYVLTKIAELINSLYIYTEHLNKQIRANLFDFVL